MKPNYENEDSLMKCAKKRATFVKKELGVRQRLAEAFALRELGYSHSGLATVLDVTEGTAKKYVRELDEVTEKDMYNLTPPEPEDWSVTMYVGREGQ